MAVSISDFAYEILVDHLEDEIEYLDVVEHMSEEGVEDDEALSAIHNEAGRQKAVIAIAYAEGALDKIIEQYGAPA